MSIKSIMLPPNKPTKRLFNSLNEPSIVKMATAGTPTEMEVGSKKPRILSSNVLSESDPCCSNNMIIEKSSQSMPSTPVKRPIHVSVQTDLDMSNSTIYPIDLPVQQSPLVSALISPQKKFRNPALSRTQSTVSISSVSNVFVSKKLTSFSSMCSMDVPSASNYESKQKLVDKKIKRPRLKHTRTAAVDGTDEPSESGQNLSKKRAVNFGNVDVYSFSFAQSFDTVPSETSIPLGMEYRHEAVQHYPSYRDFQRERFAENKDKYSLDSDMTGSKRRRIRRDPVDSVKDPKSGRFAIPLYGPSTRRISDSKWSTSDEEYVEQHKKTSPLMPMDKRRKQAIIKANSIQMDKDANEECLRIKLSRQVCGCSCANGVCKPETCECSIDGIGCQIDKPSFPCSCTKTSCENPNGRIEFDPERVREHYEKTIKRVRFENKNDKISSPLRGTSLPTQAFTIPLVQYEIAKSPLAGSFEKLGLKTPSSNNRIEKSTPRNSKITTQFSSTGSISVPFKTPPNVTKRSRIRYPVTPTYKQGNRGNSGEQPSIIELDSSGNTIMEFDDDDIQIIEPTNNLLQPVLTAIIPDICEVLISSPKSDSDFVQQMSENFSIHALSASRSLSATTTDETSRTNSTEDMIRND